MAKATKGGQPPVDVFALMDQANRAVVKKLPTKAESEGLLKIATELGMLDDRIEKGEALLKQLKERRETIQTKDLVDAMDAIGQDSMGLKEYDADITVVTKYHASLPALPNPDKKPAEYKIAFDKRQRAFEWLKKEEHDGLIVTEVVLTFPRGGAQRAFQVAEEMQQRVEEHARHHDGERPFKVDANETVHWAALTTLVKSLTVDHGRADLPLSDLGASIFRFAEITKRTERKTKAKRS